MAGQTQDITNNSLDKRIRVEWIAGLVFSCGAMYALLSQAQDDIHVNKIELEALQTEVHEVNNSVIAMEKDIGYLSDANKRIESKQDHVTLLIEELLRRSP